MTLFMWANSQNKADVLLRLAFRALDKDGSGSIETTEFVFLMTHVGKLLTCLILLSRHLLSLSSKKYFALSVNISPSRLTQFPSGGQLSIICVAQLCPGKVVSCGALCSGQRGALIKCPLIAGQHETISY